LEQCGGAVKLLQTVFVVVCQCSIFFNDPSAMSLVTAMAPTAWAQVVANMKVLEMENKVAVVEVAVAAPVEDHAQMEKVLRMGNMEGRLNALIVAGLGVLSPPFVAER
jgi:hypothetical protein